MTFAARYPGVCAECGEDFETGASLRYTDDDQVAHAACYELRPLAEVCTHCFLEKPCPCEDGQ